MLIVLSFLLYSSLCVCGEKSSVSSSSSSYLYDRHLSVNALIYRTQTHILALCFYLLQFEVSRIPRGFHSFEEKLQDWFWGVYKV